MRENKRVLVGDEVLVKREEKPLQRPVQTVPNTIRNLVLRVIDRLRKMDYSYQEISKKLGLSKSQVHKLHKRIWYPRTIKAENKLLEAVYGNR